MNIQTRTKAQGQEVRALTDGGEGAPSAVGRMPRTLYPPVSVSRGPDAERGWLRGTAHQSQAQGLALIILEIFTAWGIAGERHVF